MNRTAGFEDRSVNVRQALRARGDSKAGHGFSAYAGSLEPESLIEHFLRHPPAGFTAVRSPSGMPTFSACFDLLTTAEPALRKRISAMPLFRHWSALLRWRTRFVGSTVSEYAPLPSSIAPEALVAEVIEQFGRDQALLIVKDIALPTPLLDAAAVAQAQAFTEACEAAGMVLLEGMELAWVAIDFSSIDDFLARLSSSRRKNIRRKLRSRARLQIERIATGDAAFNDAAFVDACYGLYRSVYAQSEIHFDLLSREFFAAVFRDRQSAGMVFTYRLQGELIGWNLCYEVAGKLVDKFIGLAYPQAREHNLYAVSWMHNLDYARQRELTHYVAGWTDTAVKRELGARFSPTCHAVYVRNRLLRAVLRRFRHLFEDAPIHQSGEERP